MFFRTTDEIPCSLLHQEAALEAVALAVDDGDGMRSWIRQELPLVLSTRCSKVPAVEMPKDLGIRLGMGRREDQRLPFSAHANGNHQTGSRRRVDQLQGLQAAVFLALRMEGWQGTILGIPHGEEIGLHRRKYEPVPEG